MTRREPPRSPGEPGRGHPRERAVPGPNRWWRGLTGTCAAALTVLALAMVAAKAFSWASDGPGADLLVLVAHVLAAVAALAAQRVADRRRGGVAGAAGVFAVGLTALVLWLFWLA